MCWLVFNLSCRAITAFQCCTCFSFTFFSCNLQYETTNEVNGIDSKMQGQSPQLFTSQNTTTVCSLNTYKFCSKYVRKSTIWNVTTMKLYLTYFMYVHNLFLRNSFFTNTKLKNNINNNRHAKMYTIWMSTSLVLSKYSLFQRL